MGGATLPTPSTPGYTSFRGRTACVCLARWLPVFERLLLAAGEIRFNIDVVQLTGGAAASGGTHTQGGAFDVKQRTANAVRLGREMGAPAFWARTGAAWVGNEHAHGVLLGCPHNGPAAYQLAAQRAGFDGLGKATSGRFAGMWGYGGRDPHPAPSTYRTWEQGIAWAETEIARLTKPAPTPKPAPPVAPEDDMFSDADRATLRSIETALAGFRSEEKARYSSNFSKLSQVLAAATIDDADVTALAAKVSAALPAQGGVSQEALTAAIKAAFASLGDTPPAA